MRHQLKLVVGNITYIYYVSDEVIKYCFKADCFSDYLRRAINVLDLKVKKREVITEVLG